MHNIMGQGLTWLLAMISLKTEILVSQDGIWNDVDIKPGSSLPEAMAIEKKSNTYLGPSDFFKMGK